MSRIRPDPNQLAGSELISRIRIQANFLDQFQTFVFTENQQAKWKSWTGVQEDLFLQLFV